MHSRVLIASAFAAAIAAPALLSAQKPAEMPSFKAEKCYGIARAGKNDCASTGNNSCGGTSKKDGDKKAWIFVPEGYCERIVGGNKTAAK
jgi:uncharacterized membrane protein